MHASIYCNFECFLIKVNFDNIQAIMLISVYHISGVTHILPFSQCYFQFASLSNLLSVNSIMFHLTFHLPFTPEKTLKVTPDKQSNTRYNIKVNVTPDKMVF